MSRTVYHVGTMTERAFVTGSEGFLGRHLLQQLRKEQIHVAGYDRKFHQELCDSEHLTAALKESGATTVYHLAALADVRSAFRQPIEQRQNNFVGTAILLEAMRAADVKQIVFTSSAVVYGDTTSGTVSE